MAGSPDAFDEAIGRFVAGCKGPEGSTLAQ
jgi:hypothetical protein